MVKTKIVNATPHALKITEETAGVPRLYSNLQSKQKVSIKVDQSVTYREFTLMARDQRIFVSSDDLMEFAEITVFETASQILEWRGSRLRGSRRLQVTADIRDATPFDAVNNDASSGMKTIEKSHARLVRLSKQVKICPAQCRNLVETCLEGIKEMKEAYNGKPEDEMWQLYSSKKLGQLISSLDKLLSTLGSIQDLLQACGSNWVSMALVVSLPLPAPERMSSKFDILIKELHWNLETIHYALHLNGGLKFKWNDRKFRYVLDGPEVTVAEDMELEESRGLASEDREHLLSQLKNQSILVPGNPLPYYLWRHLGLKLANNLWRDKLAAELQKRLEETVLLSSAWKVPNCFWIKTADLKLRKILSGDRYASKSVWKGEWCGQAVAIGITKNTVKAAVEKEAGLVMKVQHPNIVGFLGCAFTCDEAPSEVRREKDEQCSAGYLVMEFMQENLGTLINRHARSHSGNPFTLAVTVDILSQIAGAMVHMHNLDIMHRDLKSTNCLVNPRSSSDSSSQVVKLIDFDRSKEVVRNAPTSKHTVNTGTRRWMAPEVWGFQMPTARKGHWFSIRGRQMFGALE